MWLFSSKLLELPGPSLGAWASPPAPLRGAAAPAQAAHGWPSPPGQLSQPKGQQLVPARMHIRIYMCVYIYTHISVYIYIYACICINMCICINICIDL